MNLYRVNIKRNYVRGLQLEEESFLIVAADAKKAEEIVGKRIGNNSNITIKNVQRIQDGAYIISDTYLVDNVS